MAQAMKIRKGDVVQILTGKDRGKQGRIIEADPKRRRVIVENLNIVKRHRKPRPMKDSSRMGQTQIQPGGVFDALGGDRGLERHGRLPDVQPRDARRLRVPRVQGRARQGARLQARGLRGGARPLMATKTKQQNGYVPRLKTRYEQELRAALKDQLEFSSVMQVPRIEKITVNMGVGEAKTNAKALDTAVEELTTITGQRAQITRAKKSIAGFKIREGMPIGTKATLRGVRMYEFLDRLVSIALPRIRDFRGLSPASFDGRGNYSIGIREQIIFPEINYDDIQEVRGLDVVITTSAKTDEEGLALLRGLGLPFRNED